MTKRTPVLLSKHSQDKEATKPTRTKQLQAKEVLHCKTHFKKKKKKNQRSEREKQSMQKRPGESFLRFYLQLEGKLTFEWMRRNTGI